MMNNRLAGILWFVLLALAFAGCSSSSAATSKVAASLTLRGTLELIRKPEEEGSSMDFSL
jgi:hypothetical protein